MVHEAAGGPQTATSHFGKVRQQRWPKPQGISVASAHDPTSVQLSPSGYLQLRALREAATPALSHLPSSRDENGHESDPLQSCMFFQSLPGCPSGVAVTQSSVTRTQPWPLTQTCPTHAQHAVGTHAHSPSRPSLLETASPTPPPTCHSALTASRPPPNGPCHRLPPSRTRDRAPGCHTARSHQLPICCLLPGL